jgi:hypothetical protein
MTAHALKERAQAMRGNIERTMQRVERLVDAETAALRARAAIDLKESNNGKSQALLEFSQAIRALGGTKLDPELIRRLGVLRSKLETNRVVLRMHLEAVREIASVVSSTIRDSEWDGTYSQHALPGGYGR